MSCETIRDAEGHVVAIACSRHRGGQRCATPGCGAPATRRCDYPLEGGKAGATCSRPCCRAHAHRQPDGRDFCAPHHARTLTRGER